MKTLCTIAAALAALTLNPLAALAQQGESLPPPIRVVSVDAAHSDLFTAMETGVDQELVLSMATTTVAGQIMATLPADMTEGKPDMQVKLAAALRDPMRTYSQRLAAEYRPRLVAVIAEVLTAAEARELADFYSSDLGKRALQAASSNLSVDNIAADGVTDMRVEAESVERDMMETGVRAFGSLSAQDKGELLRVSLTSPAFAKMPLLQQRIAPVRAEMESAPPLAEEAAAIQQAVIGVLQQYDP